MPWIISGNKKYFYSWKYVNGKSRLAYLGNGPAALAEAERLEIKRLDVNAVHAMKRSEKEADRMMAELKAMVFDQLSSRMNELGFRNHHGRWRKDDE